MSTDRAAAPFLDGRHAVVTGGSRGIGAAIARHLARAGAAVTVMGRDAAALEAVADELRETGADAGAVVCDVASDDAVRSAFAAARADRGAPWALVNNAGQAEGRPFLETDRALWNRMLAVNLTGAFLCIREALPAMLEAGDGRVVNIASTTAVRGYRNVAAYSASKHGLLGLTRALAAEVARSGITVNAVCPAYTDTAMTERAVRAVARGTGGDEADALRRITRTIQRGTLIEPREVAGTVAWLCSPDASGITGQAIVVAGGEP